VKFWTDSIVMLIDLIGLKKQALEGGSVASTLMRSFHALVRREMARDSGALDHAYVWNDSVILLADVSHGPEAYARAVHAADDLKRKVDVIAPSYAVAVKGRTFPPNSDTPSSRVTVIKASSYAMANCFEIEAEAKRKRVRGRAWYIDVRITQKVPVARSSEWIEPQLLPRGESRKVYVHRGYLWDGA
jgi:hypothetical protein